MLASSSVQPDGDLARQRRERRQEPRRERVGVDRDAERRRAGVLAGELGGGVGLQQLDLAGEPQHGLAGGGRPRRLAADEQHAARSDLECAQPLADGRGRDVQRGRGGVERPVLDDRAQGPELREIELHRQQR